MCGAQQNGWAQNKARRSDPAGRADQDVVTGIAVDPQPQLIERPVFVYTHREPVGEERGQGVCRGVRGGGRDRLPEELVTRGQVADGEQSAAVEDRRRLREVDGPDAAGFRERFDPEPWVIAERDAWLIVDPVTISGRQLRGAEPEWPFRSEGYL